MPTRALCTFGVSGGPIDTERDILSIADDFRADLCALYHERHKAIVDFRNAHFPSLWRAMVESEAVRAKIWEIEHQIKHHHSEARDRNARSVEEIDSLKQARLQLSAVSKIVREEKQRWTDTLRVFAGYWQSLADWKNVKTLAKRRAMYAEIQWPQVAAPYQSAMDSKQQARKTDAEPWTGCIDPEIIAAYGAMWMAFDLRERELYGEYSPRLHSSIRAEIIESSQPKLGKDAPGMRYVYGRNPEIRPWQKLTTNFVGGLTFREAIEGKSRALRIEPWKQEGGGWRYRVCQQIGTSANPCIVRYVLRADRPLPMDDVIQRWSLVVRDNGKREVIPIVKTDETKPVGQGAMAYKLSWTMRAEGVEVARFYGDHVNERLIISRRLLDLRMAVKDTQQKCDLAANNLLTARGATPAVKQKQGVEALAVWCESHPLDNAAANLLFECKAKLSKAREVAARTAGAIEKIYETTVRRVCSLHDTIVHHDLDLAKIKRYDTRDLLRDDVLPARSREIMFAVAPGKLKALLRGYGLASGDMEPELPVDARETDVFTTYVASVRGRWLSNRGGKRGRSQRASGAVMA